MNTILIKGNAREPVGRRCGLCTEAEKTVQKNPKLTSHPKKEKTEQAKVEKEFMGPSYRDCNDGYLDFSVF